MLKYTCIHLWRGKGGRCTTILNRWCWTVRETPCRHMYFQVDCMQYILHILYEHYWALVPARNDFKQNMECLNYCIYHVINIIQIQHEFQTIELRDMHNSSGRRQNGRETLHLVYPLCFSLFIYSFTVFSSTPRLSLHLAYCFSSPRSPVHSPFSSSSFLSLRQR